MHFDELLIKRRSVRNFEDRSVPVEIIKALINDSIKAPNSGNSQAWKFIIVNNREIIKRLSDAGKAAILSDIEAHPDSPMKQYEKHLRNEKFNVFYNAPCLVCIVGREDNPNIAMDCALAGSYLMLSATAKGLATCWVALGAEIRDPALLNEMDMPKGYRIFAPIVVGYPKAIPDMPKRKEADIIRNIS
jgi:nitroreductase